MKKIKLQREGTVGCHNIRKDLYIYFHFHKNKYRNDKPEMNKTGYLYCRNRWKGCGNRKG